MHTRRRFLAATTTTAFALPEADAAGRRPPNIVFIMADDLGVGDLGCYGQRKIRTPHIDSLARDGMKFTQAYAGCTVCAPSRSVLMTGYHMGHTSVRGNTGGQSLAPEDVTVAMLLKQAGYATGGFGKWGLGDLGTPGVPWRKGFDRFFGYLHQVHAHFYYPKILMDNDKRYPLAGNENGGRKTYSHDVIAGEGLRFIEENKDKPFFCYMPFTVPHWELLVPEDSLAEYRGKFPEWAFVDKSGHYADQPEGRAAYAAMITRLDRDVGRVLALLDRLKLRENTIIFFTSDNGAALPIRNEDYFESTGGLRGHKQNLYEGGIRTPMLVRWPGRIRAGATSDVPWNFASVLPTLCEIAGVKLPKPVDGISMTPTLFGKGKQRLPEYLYWEQPRFDGKARRFREEVPMQAARVGDWKIVRPEPGGEKLELYNLREDPREARDLAGDRPAELARMKKVLAGARTPPRPLDEPGKYYWDE